MRVRLKLDRLIRELSKSNKSQNHWAITLGLSRGHLSEILNGKHPYPSPKTREKLVISLGLQFEDLFDIEPHSGKWSHASSAAFQAALHERFIIDVALGEGGMGSVYLGRDIRHGRRVAIKVISPEAISGIGIQQFLREIRFAAALQHQHILPLYDSGEAAGYPYFVMPYVEEGSLRNRLERSGAMDVDSVVSLIGALAEGLEHAHNARVVHCDVKPENILISGTHPWLADFGISRAIHAEVRALGKRAGFDTSAGTPAYVSPEQASGEPHIDGRADVYSLACVAFEMLAGDAPFTGSTTLEIISKRFDTLPPDVRQRAPHVSEPLSHVLRRAMAVDPAQRFVSVTAFANALADAARTGRVFGASVRHHMTRVRNALPNIERAIPQKLRGRWMTDLPQDVTFAVRGFRKRWAQTLVLLLTATIGIGLNSAVFSIVHAVILRALPYPDAQQLVKIWRGTTTDDRQGTLSYADFSDVSNGTTGLETVAAYVGVRQPIVGGETPTHGAAYTTTERFFDVFGVPPLLGTTRSADDGSPVAIISYGLWQRSFGRDSLVLQRAISISGRSMPIAGVMPRGFAYPRDGEAWMPQEIGRMWGFDRGAGGLHLVGRMGSDVTVEALRSQLDAVASQVRTAEPAWSTLTYPPVPLHDTLAANGRATLTLLLGVVAMILLVACANIAGVFTADIVGRQREMTVRRALGASTTRLIRQMLTETTLLGVTGAVLALVAAQLSVAFVNGLVPAGYLHSGDVRLELPVVLFTLAVGVGSGVLFGLLPALRVAAHELRGQALRKEDLQRGGPRYLGGFLVIPQYALSLAVVVVALVMVKSLFSLMQVDPGFLSEGLVTAEIGLTRDRYEESEPQVAFRNALVAELEARPGVTSVAFEYTPPLVPGANIQNGVQLPDDPDRIVALAQWRTVTPQYFRTAGIPVLQGRAFQQSDGPQATGVVVVNRALAGSLWPDNETVGRRLRPRLLFLSGLNFGNGGWMTVVGVVGDVHHRTLSGEPFPAVYLPASQHPGRAISMHLVMKVSPIPDNLSAIVVDAVARIDPNVPVGSVSLMDEWVRRSVAAPRFRAGLLAVFGAIAVTLVLLGMYGVISQSVRHRSRELAVRAALGADSGRVIRLVTSECVRYVLAGQLIGTALVLVGTRWLDSLVFGISGFDFTTYAAVSVLLTAVVLGACYLPARRAGRANPVDALREQ